MPQTQTEVEIDTTHTLRKDLEHGSRKPPEPEEDTYRYVEETNCAGTFCYKINNRTGKVSEV